MAKLTGISLGGSSVVAHRSATEIAASSFQLGTNDAGVIGVQFTTTDDGRGTGGQFIPLDDLDNFCDVLEGFADPASLTGKVAASNPVEIMRATMAYVDEEIGPNDPVRVSFRTAVGQGMKPTRLPQNEIPAVVEFLRSRIEPARAAVALALAAKAKK